jgi:Copper transport outer membrane protein, MctB
LIDFRYHLISIIAVFLALGIGILMGSLVLEDRLVRQIRSQLESIGRRNDELQAEVVDLKNQIDADEGFARIAREYLIKGQLDGEHIVVFTYERTDGGLMDQLRATVEEAGGSLTSTIEATEKLSLETPAERDQLALALSSSSSSAADLHQELGDELGDTAAAAAGSGGTTREPLPAAEQVGPAAKSLDGLVADLADAGFLNVDRPPNDEPLVPPGADFVVVGGSEDAPPFQLSPYTVALSSHLARDGAPVLAAESSTSSWGIVTSLRADGDAQDAVTTVDQAESISGSVAMVLGLEQADAGIVGKHYGVAPDAASGIIPEPPPTP